MATIYEIIDDIDDFHTAHAYYCSPESCINYISNDLSLKIIHTNIRSINKNFNNFIATLVTTNIEFDIIILSECWLKASGNLPQLDGYTAHSTSNNPLQNDGVVLYIKTVLNSLISEPPICDSNCLICWVGDVAIVAVYRSPSYVTLDNFYTSLENIINTLKCPCVALIGDINVDIKPNNNNRNSDEYLTFMSSMGLLPAHLLPTRVGNCLDHIMLKTKYKATVTVIQTEITDHYPTVLSLKLKKQDYKSVPNYVTKYDYFEIKKDVDKFDFGKIMTETDPEQGTLSLITAINTLIEQHKTVIKISRKSVIIKPWITPGMLRCIRNRDAMHLKLKNSPNNNILKTTYRRYRNFCNDLLRKLKITYEKCELEKAKNNPKELWNVIKTITNSKKNKSDPSELLSIACDKKSAINRVNEFFVSVGRNLAAKIAPTPEPPPPDNFSSHNHMSNSFVILPIDEAEVKNLIHGLRSDCAAGWDDIPPRVIKQSNDILAPVLTHVFNLCITRGVFPRALKHAIVHPIHKGGSRDFVPNYRPISILTALSKILERYLNTCLIKYLEKYRLLSNNQYGFRSSVSTEDAILNFVSNLVNNIDNKLKCYGVFLDLAKAFDTVSVPILLSKLERLGVRGLGLNIFASYLSERTQSVKIGSLISDKRLICYGVPQGSILGPTLFLVYMDQLCSMSLQNCNIFAYADDTALLIYGDSWESAKKHAENALRRVKEWLSGNLLTLNLDKTKVVQFDIAKISKPKLLPPVLRIHNCSTMENNMCDCKPLDTVQTIKYLGVHLDDRLDWHVQIKSLSARVRSLIYLFKNLRHSADRKTLFMVYLGLCQSVISYCIPVWGGANKTSLLKLERAQRAILKVMTFKKRTYSTANLYNECKVLSVRQLFVLRTLLRKHRSLPYSTATANKRRGAQMCPPVKCRTTWAKQQYNALSCSLYNRMNKLSPIYTLPNHTLKKTLQELLLTLNYNDTENMLK